MRDADIIRKKVKQVFPHRNENEVMEILDTYSKAAYQKEKARVQLAILTLCDEDGGELENYLERAKQDYRDVLY